MMPFRCRRPARPRPAFLSGFVVALLLAGCAATSHAPSAAQSADVRRVLAPTGPLRVAVYSGSPSSIVVDPAGGAPRGVGYDLGRAFAARLGVPFAPVVFANNAQALAAIRDGSADLTFTNASPARAREMDFSPVFMDVEKSALVARGSPVRTLADLQRPGTRIGVSAGSTTAGELAPLYPDATIVPIATLAEAKATLGRGEIVAFATNDAILYEMSDALPGSTVIAGHWGLEHFAAGVPKGRAADHPDAAAVIAAFIDDARRDGTIATAVAHAGLRGVVPPPR